MAEIVSRPYWTGEDDKACSKCCFWRGKHAEFCETIMASLERIDDLITEAESEEVTE